MAKFEKVLTRRVLEDYIVWSLVTHGVWFMVFLPYNIYFLGFSNDQLIKAGLGGLPLAFAWNYVGMRVNVLADLQLKRIIHKTVDSLRKQ